VMPRDGEQRIAQRSTLGVRRSLRETHRCHLRGYFTEDLSGAATSRAPDSIDDRRCFDARNASVVGVRQPILDFPDSQGRWRPSGATIVSRRHR
jgi:hypothetical protein